jgi:hypothetical protein
MPPCVFYPQSEGTGALCIQPVFTAVESSRGRRSRGNILFLHWQIGSNDIGFSVNGANKFPQAGLSCHLLVPVAVDVRGFLGHRKIYIWQQFRLAAG